MVNDLQFQLLCQRFVPGITSLCITIGLIIGTCTYASAKKTYADLRHQAIAPKKAEPYVRDITNTINTAPFAIICAGISGNDDQCSVCAGISTRSLVAERQSLPDVYKSSHSTLEEFALLPLKL